MKLEAGGAALAGGQAEGESLRQSRHGLIVSFRMLPRAARALEAEGEAYEVGAIPRSRAPTPMSSREMWPEDAGELSAGQTP